MCPNAQNNEPHNPKKARPGGSAKSGAKGKKGSVGWVLLSLLVILAVCIFIVFHWILPEFTARGQQDIEAGLKVDGVLISSDMPALEATEDAGDEYIETTLFLGDSNTVRMVNYELLSPNQVMAKENIGIVDVRELAFVEVEGSAIPLTIVQALRYVEPERIIMTFGTNDIRDLSPNAFIREYQKSLEAIREVYSGPLIVNAIPPVRRNRVYDHITNEKIQTYNYLLRNMCAEEGLPYLESGEVLSNQNGWCLPPYMVNDGVHFTEKGAEVLLDYIRTHAYEW